MNFIRHTLLLSILISLNCYVFSQPVNGNLDILSVVQGVDGLEVNNFFFDKDNKIWLSTTNCLNICTPKSVENIYLGDGSKNIHSDERVIQIFDNKNTVDVFYENVIDFYDKYDKKKHKFEKIRIHLKEETSQQKYIETILFNNKIFIVSQDEELIYIKDVYNLKQKTISFSKKLNKIIIYKNGYYLLSKRGTIYHVGSNNKVSIIPVKKPKDNVKFTFKGKPVKQNIQIFHLDIKGRLWYSPLQETGVYLKRKGEMVLKRNNDFPKEKLFTWISEDETGKLLFGSTNIFRFTEEFYILDLELNVKEWAYLRSQFKLPKKLIAKDFYKEIFVSTYRNLMILNFNKSDFIISSFVNKEVKNNEGAYGNVIWGISQINDDSIFITSEKPSWSLYDKFTHEELSTYYLNEKLYLLNNYYSPKDNKIWCIGNIIGSKNKQLIRINYSENIYESISVPGSIFSFVRNRDNDFYIGAKSQNDQYCIYIINPQTDNVTKILDIPFQPYFMQYDTVDNSLWCIDFKKGAFHIELDNIEKNIKLLDFDKSRISSFYSINIGILDKIFISTNNGLYIWDKEERKLIKHISTETGLSANGVCSAIEDKKGNLWISTFSGLNHYYCDFDRIHTYYVEDGLANNEFNTKAFYSDFNNNMFFGNSNGLVKVDFNIFEAKTFNIQIDRFLTGDKNNSKIYSELKEKTIKIHHNNKTEINVTLGITEWSNKETIRFYSYLYPYDKGWSKSTFNNKFSFKYLPPGKYKMQFIAINSEGVLSNTLEVPFIIYQKWYETNWFYILILAFFMNSLAFTGFYYFNKEKRIKERTKLKFEKRISELELGVLQAQMNPHFVFNSIGAIQAKVHSGETEIVSQYLNDFASLMRLYLESSRTKTLTLNNEIKLLRLYMNLEKMRFEDKLQFEINVDSNIDIDYSTIPSMILQPFVENSINHGLFHKKAQGHIWINIKEDEDESVLISIIDDGIGRKKAKEIKEKSLHGHKSRALQIIEERIAVLKELQDCKIEIKIEDLYDDDKNATGTAVYIKFPNRVGFLR